MYIIVFTGVHYYYIYMYVRNILLSQCTYVVYSQLWYVYVDKLCYVGCIETFQHSKHVAMYAPYQR